MSRVDGLVQLVQALREQQVRALRELKVPGRDLLRGGRDDDVEQVLLPQVLEANA